tara:strand:- start:329 stop:724 length:396 start_codon:yes stop_codon:yes gene_type:complete
MPILSKTSYDTAPDHHVEVFNMSGLFLEELAKVHDSLTETGFKGSERNMIITELDAEHWTDGDQRVLAIVESEMDPDRQLILIYNWKGVLRMTGIQTDSHGCCYIYRTNEKPPSYPHGVTEEANYYDEDGL